MEVITDEEVKDVEAEDQKERKEVTKNEEYF